MIQQHNKANRDEYKNINLNTVSQTQKSTYYMVMLI